MRVSGHTVFLVGVAAAVFWIGYAASTVVTPLLAALLLAYVLDPIVRRLQRIGLSRSVASGLTVAVAFVTIVGGSVLAATRIAEEAASFYADVVGEPAVESASEADAARALAKSLTSPSGKFTMRAAEWDGRNLWYADHNHDGRFQPGYARQGYAKLRREVGSGGITAQIAERLQSTEDIGTRAATSFGRWLAGLADAGRTAAASLFTLLVLFPIYLYYSLAKLAWVHETAVKHLPAAHRDRIVDILGKIHVTLSAFFRGRLILLGARFVLLLGLFIGFGIPFAGVCAAFAAVASLVPVLGPVAGAAVPILLSISAGATSGETLALTGALVLLELADNYLATPAILGKRVGLHPLTILVATFVAADLFGIFGMLIAVPLAAVLKIVAIEYVLPEVRLQAGLPSDPDPT